MAQELGTIEEVGREQVQEHQQRRHESIEKLETVDTLEVSSSDSDSQTIRSPSRSPRFAMPQWMPQPLQRTVFAISKFLSFIGPGFMVAVAYIDPGNYSTDVSAGANTQFKLLFVVLMSNIFAVVLQSLAVRLGTVTGMDLAQMCRAHLPSWLNWTLYILAECAIIATDIAEVIGSAIALNLLSNGKIPLVAGCAITIVEVLVILVFYQPNGSMRGVKLFEYLMVGLVLGVVACFCIQLSMIENTGVGEVFYGYVPSSTVVTGQGLYLSCGILGATVMPHSLYLGSGLCKPRLKAYDEQLRQDNSSESDSEPETDEKTESKVQHQRRLSDDSDITLTNYKPSLAAIKHCLTTSTIELVISLCIFALFVNSAILITAGSSLYGDEAAADADIFGIYDLLSASISKAAGTVFALALLLSGLSAGIVCTIAGQMVSEGAINWTIKPWLRQLITRAISIIPSVVIAAAVGKDGLNAALNGTQVALSIILPFVSAPLVYFTCRNKYMTVGGVINPGAAVDKKNTQGEDGVSVDEEEEKVGMRSHRIVSLLAILIWLVITIMNVALLVFLGLGED